MKDLAGKRVLKQMQKNYRAMAEAFRKGDCGKRRKFLRWTNIHKAFYNGGLNTVSKEQKPFLLDAIVRINRLERSVRRPEWSEDVVKQAVEDCEELYGLLDRTIKAM